MRTRIMIAAVIAVTAIGGKVAEATVSSVAHQATSQRTDVLAPPAIASNRPLSANLPSATEFPPAQRKLPLANFGQWTESASEN